MDFNFQFWKKYFAEDAHRLNELKDIENALRACMHDREVLRLKRNQPADQDSYTEFLRLHTIKNKEKELETRMTSVEHAFFTITCEARRQKNSANYWNLNHMSNFKKQ